MQVRLQAVFVLASVLRARDISREDQTGDCDEHIEKLNIVHTHHSPLLYEIAERTTRRPYLPARLHSIISQDTSQEGILLQKRNVSMPPTFLL